MPEEQNKDVWKIFNECAEQHPELLDLAFDIRNRNETLQRIRPIYERLYRHWLCKRFMPFDTELENKMLFRCRTCNGLFWSNGTEDKKHMGHIFGFAKRISLWEWVKLKLGIIK